MASMGDIRRSASGEAQASEETQRETVQRLAEARGDTITRVYRDWGRSGGSETQPEYLAMLAEAEAGHIHAIYAYDQDRLARSNFFFASLLRLADLRGFAVVDHPPATEEARPRAGRASQTVERARCGYSAGGASFSRPDLR